MYNRDKKFIIHIYEYTIRLCLFMYYSSGHVYAQTRRSNWSGKLRWQEWKTDMFEDARNRAAQLMMNHTSWHPKPRNNYEKLCKKIPTASPEPYAYPAGPDWILPGPWPFWTVTMFKEFFLSPRNVDVNNNVLKCEIWQEKYGRN